MNLQQTQNDIIEQQRIMRGPHRFDENTNKYIPLPRNTGGEYPKSKYRAPFYPQIVKDKTQQEIEVKSMHDHRMATGLTVWQIKTSFPEFCVTVGSAAEESALDQAIWFDTPDLKMRQPEVEPEDLQAEIERLRRDNARMAADLRGLENATAPGKEVAFEQMTKGDLIIHAKNTFDIDLKPQMSRDEMICLIRNAQTK